MYGIIIAIDHLPESLELRPESFLDKQIRVRSVLHHHPQDISPMTVEAGLLAQIPTVDQNNGLGKRDRFEDLNWVQFCPGPGGTSLISPPGKKSRAISNREERVVLGWTSNWGIRNPPSNV